MKCEPSASYNNKSKNKENRETMLETLKPGDRYKSPKIKSIKRVRSCNY